VKFLLGYYGNGEVKGTQAHMFRAEGQALHLPDQQVARRPARLFPAFPFQFTHGNGVLPQSHCAKISSWIFVGPGALEITSSLYPNQTICAI
jgi:hypothetical protein